MEKIERFDIDGPIYQNDDEGDWIRYSDFLAYQIEMTNKIEYLEKELLKIFY